MLQVIRIAIDPVKVFQAPLFKRSKRDWFCDFFSFPIEPFLDGEAKPIIKAQRGGAAARLRSYATRVCRLTSLWRRLTFSVRN